LSIQLPSSGKIIIGSPENEAAHIRLPGVEDNMGYINIDGQKTYFKPTTKGAKNIKINGIRPSSKSTVALKHNTLITFEVVPPPPSPKPQETTSRDTRIIDPQATKIMDTDYDPKNYSPSHPKIYRFVYYNRFLDPQA
jgi:hypothetical protein